MKFNDLCILNEECTNKQNDIDIHLFNFSHSWERFDFFPLWDWQRAPQLLAAISLLLSFPLTFHFSSPIYWSSDLLKSSLKQIFPIWLAHSYLTISANYCWRWGVFSCCRSLDCFGRRHSSYLDCWTVYLFITLLTIPLWTNSNLISPQADYNA